jgi:hypothetical protein
MTKKYLQSAKALPPKTLGRAFGLFSKARKSAKSLVRFKNPKIP